MEPDPEILELPLSLIVPWEDQPRRGPKGDYALVESIRALGVLEPLIVYRDGEVYRLVAGERRYWAAREAGLERVPVRVVPKPDPGTLHQMALAENLTRAPLDAFETVEAVLKHAFLNFGHTEESFLELLRRTRTDHEGARRRRTHLDPLRHEGLKALREILRGFPIAPLTFVVKYAHLFRLPPEVRRALAGAGLSLQEALELVRDPAKLERIREWMGRLERGEVFTPLSPGEHLWRVARNVARYRPKPPRPRGPLGQLQGIVERLERLYEKAPEGWAPRLREALDSLTSILEEEGELEDGYEAPEDDGGDEEGGEG
ncbi:ParB/RepB/Spo0J family partition protein [Thermus oshimai]|uniref:ParB/RepB/Spo0J family partition protein n=1 Tax=Thermus oshimai TaxID=56957 RepID=UPI0003619DF4|nr:ParB/RepB/Spo0J family partition protein [Thermus oshimai]